MQTIERSDYTVPPGPGAVRRAPSKINWGGVLKGAAIVTGVVLTGVALFYAASAGYSLLLGEAAGASSINTLLGSAWNGLTWVGSQIAYAGGLAWNFISAIPAAIVTTFGLTGSIGAGASAASTGVGLAVGAAGVAVAAPAAIHAFNNTQMTTPAPDTGVAHQATAIHTAQHAGQHVAAEHTTQRPRWTQRVNPKQTDFGNFAQREAAKKDTFADQINADRMALEQALKQK